MLTRPPPAPRTRTTGRAPRRAQVRPLGGFSPWPASSSRQMKAARSCAALLTAATPRPSTPRWPAHHVPSPGGRGPGKTSRAGASASTWPRCCTRHGTACRSLPWCGPASSAGPRRTHAPAPLGQVSLRPRPLLRAQPLPRHRPSGPQRSGSAGPPGPPPPPHRTLGDPQLLCDLADPVATGEPLSCLQPQPLTPLLLGGRVPAPLPIPHAPVIRPKAADVTTRSLRVQPGYLRAWVC